MKDFAVAEALVKFICCFVPTKRWRRSIRYRLVVNPRLQHQLLSQGFVLNDGVMTTPQGVRIDVSNTPDCPLYLVREVFVKSEYNLDISRESVLIDIGMNRAAVSLRFAANQNIKSIYAFEPFRPTFESARRNLELNPQLSEKIHTFNVGLGRKEATLELPYQSTRTGGMSTTHDACKGQKNVTTETVIIKDAAKEITTILEDNKNKYIIVKCDCEGAEFEIFDRLAEQGLVGRIDVVIMEYHFEPPDRLVKILTREDFAVQRKSASQKAKTGYIYAVRMAEKNC
ncbi:MAG: FkbM family methyltransferase [Planctomycetota bacterium]|jgi:FkbM family methyltransferase